MSSLASTSSLDDSIEQVLIGFNVHPRELQNKQKLKRLGRQKAAAAAASRVQSMPQFAEDPFQKAAALPIGDESDLGFQILQRGVHTFPLDLMVKIIFKSISDRDEMALQSDIEHFLQTGGIWDAAYRAPGRHLDQTAIPSEQDLQPLEEEDDDDAMVPIDLDIQSILDSVSPIAEIEKSTALNSTLDRILQMDSILEHRLLVKSIRGGINGGIDKDTKISARMGWMLLVSRLIRRGLLPSYMQDGLDANEIISR